MTTSRRVWRGINEAGQLRPVIEQHEAFGWRVHRHVLPVGAAVMILAERTIERAQAPNRALYVRGRGVVSNSLGGQFDDRVPGMFTAERPDHPEGATRVTAVEEVEFWCFNWHANRGALPDLTPLRFADGGVYLGQEGDRVLVCSGAFGRHEPGDTFRVGGDELVAAPGTYALVIGGDRV
jgi:hypothetical protein